MKVKINEAQNFTATSFGATSFGGIGQEVFELNKSDKKTPTVTLNKENISIDANFWLPLAAQAYNISGDIRDYILVPLPAMFSDLPNTNGDSISKRELLKFNPEMGMPAFKTFKGKPTFVEHANNKITQAKGVILDVYLRILRGYGNGKFLKMVSLLGFDRTKDSYLCNKILKKEINTYSIGMYYNSYVCSVCGNTVTKTSGKSCSHTSLNKKTYMDDNTRLVYRHCNDIVGFETSVVEDPAYVVALSDYVINV